MLTPAQRMAHNPTSLVGRFDLLRATTRGAAEPIVVASFAVLAWGEGDLLTVLAAAAARGSTVTALDSGVEVGPDQTALALSAALTAYREGRKRDNEVEKGKKGGAVSAERRIAASLAKIEPYKHQWGQPDQVQIEVLARMGVTRNTAIEHLGQWRDARIKIEKEAKRAERKKS